MFRRNLRLAVVAVVMVGLTAVGGVSQAAGTPGWRIVGTLPGGARMFAGIEADGSGDAWIPGAMCTDDTCARMTLVVRHWTGKSWQPVAVPKAFVDSPTLGGFNPPSAVSSPSSVWIFAPTRSGQTTSVLRWTGKAWKAPATLHADIDTAVAPNGNDVWTFGSTFPPAPTHIVPYVAHYNGSKWSAASFPLLAVDASATSASDIWMIGLPPKLPIPQVAVGIMRFNGHKWVTTPLPSLGLTSHETAVATGIAAVSPSNVWATGEIEIQPSSTDIYQGWPFLLHWNGTKWSKVNVPSLYSSEGLAPINGAIAQDGHGGVWLSVTNTLGASPPGALLHYNNGTWTQLPAPAAKGYVDAPSVLAWIPGTRSVWGIGSDTPPAGDGVTVILKYGT